MPSDWAMKRHTVCRSCDRRTFTDQDAVCRRCFVPAAPVDLDSFEEADET